MQCEVNTISICYVKVFLIMFPEFPFFRALGIDDKAMYEELIKDFPPYSDITFSTLQIWWNLENQLEFTILDKNIVIKYHLPFDERNSGLSVIGTQNIDSVFQTIFDYLHEQKRPMRLVHVPEFVIENLKHRSNYEIEEESDYNEYILDPIGLSKLQGSRHAKIRTQLNRFHRETQNNKIDIRPINLSASEASDDIFAKIIEWEEKQKSNNDPDHTERNALKRTLHNSETLGTKNFGLYADAELRAILVYHETHDKKAYILNHLKVDYSIPYIYDYMVHHLAKIAHANKIDHLNMEMDLGIENLRRHKKDFQPIHFLKKYTIRLKKTS